MTEVISQSKKKMSDALDHFRKELKNIRTGRANPELIENIGVEVYGTQMRLRDIANITCPEPRQLLITPFDANNTSGIGSAIEKANLNLRPIVEGNMVRINIPEMTKERREEMIQMLNRKKEESKVSIRNVRKEANTALKNEKNDGILTEDDVKKHEKEIQNLTDKSCEQVDEVAKTKESEILTI